MKKSTHAYPEGSIIFSQGDQGDSVFAVITGQVALSISGKKGPLQVAILKAGDFFGELSVLDGGKRTATAHALDDVTVTIIRRDVFMDGLKSDSALSLAVMRRMASRLRQADEWLARPETMPKLPKLKKPTNKQNQDKPGLLSFLFGGSKSKKKIPPAHPLNIHIAHMPGDIDARQARKVAAILAKFKGIRVHVQKLPPQLDFGERPDIILMNADVLRKGLTAAGGDLLVWCDIPDPGASLRLRFVANGTGVENMTGATNPVTFLSLPVDFDDSLAGLLAAVCLAASAPTDPGKLLAMQKALFSAVDGAMMVARSLPTGLTSHEQAAIHFCFANAVATLGALKGADELFRVAAQFYQQAGTTLARDKTSIEWGLLQKQLGTVLHEIGERSGDIETLEAAAQAFRAALKNLARDETPYAWAAAQQRLGRVLHRLYLDAHDTELLKWALAAYQDSLQVFNKTITPETWCDVMINFAQAARDLGEQAHSLEVLEKAADSCRAVLTTKDKDQDSQSWASIQSILGTTLYFLGRQSGETSHLINAISSFESAKEIYSRENITAQIDIAAKNIIRAEALLPKATSSPAPALDWERDEKSSEN